MNLREIRAAYPHLFYQHPVAWWDEEPFATRHVGEPVDLPVSFTPKLSPFALALPLAVSLTWAYVLAQGSPVWVQRWFWCADKDTESQRVYIGQRHGLWEVHRHLELTNRWGVAVW